MRRFKLLFSLTLLVSFAAFVYAGYDDGKAAFEKGDYTKAYDEFKPLADQGDVSAQKFLGKLYEMLARFVDEGKDSRAQKLFSGLYEAGADGEKYRAEAMKWYRNAAEQGDAEAQCSLGWMYNNRESVQMRNYTEAEKWYRKAAEQGYAEAQIGLAIMYLNGLGVTPDYSEAMKWYRKAAEQGNIYGQIGLAARYAYGEGVPQDLVQAYMWYNLAAVNSPSAGALRDALAKQMTPSQIEEAERLARELKPNGKE